MLEVDVLGPLLVRQNGRSIGKIPKKAGALVAYLACHPGQQISRERLADLLWPHQGTPQARHGLRNCLLELRRSLGSRDAIAGNFVDCGVAAVCDLDKFKNLAASDDADELASAMRLYRGELLEDLDIASEPWDEWVACEREKLRRIAGRGLGLLVEIATTAGSHDLAIEAGYRAVEIDSLSEAAWRLLIQALAAAGQRVEAVKQYRRCENILRQELRILPDTETQALIASIYGGPTIRDLRAECKALGIKGQRALAGIDGTIPTKGIFREMVALLLRVGKHSSRVLEAASSGDHLPCRSTWLGPQAPQAGEVNRALGQGRGAGANVPAR